MRARVKFVLAVLMFVAIVPAALPLAAIECPKEPAAAWAKELSETEKAATIATASNLPRAYLAAYLSALTTEQKVAVWRNGLSKIPYPSAAYPQTPARDAAIEKYRSVLNAQFFEDLAKHKEELGKLKSEILAAFDQDMLYRLSQGAGQLQHKTTEALPISQKVAVFRTKLPSVSLRHPRDFFRAWSGVLSAKDDDCWCNSDWGCPILPGWSCLSGPGVCTWTDWGCGWFLTEGCYGICATIGNPTQ